MPGKGGMRSRSTPRERPQSPSAGDTHAHAHAHAFSRSSPQDCAAAGSPRVGTPTGPRKLSTLKLSGTSGPFSGSLSYLPPLSFSFGPLCTAQQCAAARSPRMLLSNWNRLSRSFISCLFPPSSFPRVRASQRKIKRKNKEKKREGGGEEDSKKEKERGTRSLRTKVQLPFHACTTLVAYQRCVRSHIRARRLDVHGS
jgi:hypothetical protein